MWQLGAMKLPTFAAACALAIAPAAVQAQALSPTELAAVDKVVADAERTSAQHVAVAKAEAENARVAVRAVRRDTLSDIKELLKEKEISQDEERKAEQEQLRLQFELHVYAGLRARGEKAAAERFLADSPVRAAFPKLLAKLNLKQAR